MIKNTYDADAKKCVVYYENSTDRLFIIDNGIGMNKDVIINNWMTIGNSTKKESVFTKSGRVNTGENAPSKLDTFSRPIIQVKKVLEDLH